MQLHYLLIVLSDDSDDCRCNICSKLTARLLHE